MRISAGIAKGRKIDFSRPPEKNRRDELRPTSAKVREALFDILMDKITGAAFLDLYAGTGAVGIEALSRGAEKAVFVEENPARIKALNGLLDELGFKDRTIVVAGRAVDFIEKTRDAFDVIFADPPYFSGELDIILPVVCGKGVLKMGGILVAEHSSKRKLMDAAEGMTLRKTYKYGDTALSLFVKDTLQKEEL